jgi:hypothetical protein
VFIASDGMHDILTSADGVHWTDQQVEIAPLDIGYGKGQFVSVGNGILTSTDGVNWRTPWRLGTTAAFAGVCYGNGHFVAVGNGGRILESGSIISLGLTAATSSGPLKLSLEGPTGQTYTIQTSTDLVAWRNLTNITTTQPTSAIFDALPVGSNRLFYRAYSQ